MSRSRPDEIVGGRGGRLAALRERHPVFICEKVITGDDLKVSRSDLADAYACWIGITERDRRGKLRYSTDDIHNLFVLIRAIPDVREDCEVARFYGVGLA